ncbi:MAG: hypothetical protein ACREMQ_15670 [Longimicrobiales bacterium]
MAIDSRPLRFAQGGVSALGLVVAVSAGAQAPHAVAANGSRITGYAPAPITFAKDVAPILQAKCQSCHRPGSIAPMPLIEYADVAKYALKIKMRVQQRTMPPWHIDRSVGITQFKNDRSLSDEQADTIIRWVDDGARLGDPKDLPAPITWPDPGVWQLKANFGEPDLIIKSLPYSVEKSGQDKWWRPTVETGVMEPRWVKAIEIKPSLSGRKSVHHVLTLLEQHEEGGLTNLASTMVHATSGRQSAGLFMEWAIGKTGEIFNDNAGKLILPDSRIRWEVHYYATGEPVKDDVVELGVWLYPKGYVPQNRTILTMYNAAPGSNLDIAPNETATTTNTYVLRAPARIENFQPHMHMRGKSMTMEALYPDGTRELLSKVSNFQWRWHVNYIYADSVAPLLPTGTTLIFTAVHDNTAQNRNNPDPGQWVGWGDRTVDEMAHTWVDVTYLEQAEFDKLVAARKKKVIP